MNKLDADVPNGLDTAREIRQRMAKFDYVTRSHFIGPGLKVLGLPDDFWVETDPQAVANYYALIRQRRLASRSKRPSA